MLLCGLQQQKYIVIMLDWLPYCTLNELNFSTNWIFVIRKHSGASSTLTALGMLQLRAFGFVHPLILESNYRITS